MTVKHEQTTGHVTDAEFRVLYKPAATFTSCGPGSMDLTTVLGEVRRSTFLTREV